MIPDKEIKIFREALLASVRPLIFFDDDPDGVCSFLQCYKLNPEARGVICKIAGPLNEIFLKKVKSFQPDAIFILDVPMVAQEFLDQTNNVYWLDHHTPLKLKNVKYFNPMLHDEHDERPVSYWCNKVAQSSLWLAMVGCVGDWFLPEDLREEFFGKYPDLLPKEITKPEEALFSSPIGELSRAFSFILKGKTNDAMTCTKVLSRIKEPYEILHQTSPKGKFIWKKYKKISVHYQNIKSQISKPKDQLLTFFYEDNTMSLTSELSNEVLFENPDKFIVIGREKNGDVKCSLRSAKYEVLPILKNALKGLDGHGGGHLHACGASVRKDDMDTFLNAIRSQLA